EKTLLLVLALFSFLVLLYALTPSIQSDGLRYHLAAPQQWLRRGRLVYLPHQAFSNFPALVEMLFMFGLGLAGDLLAKGFHFLFLPLSAGAIGLICRDLQGEWDFAPSQSPWRVAMPLLAATIFISLPLVGPLAGWAFIDLAVLYFTLAMIHFLLRYYSRQNRKSWILAAIFGGLLCASKYTGVVFVFFGGVMILLADFVPRQKNVRPISAKIPKSLTRFVLFGFIAAALAYPWWIKNVVYTGNPVYPMAWSVFEGGEWDEDLAEAYHAKTREKGIREVLAGAPDAITKIRLITSLPWLTAHRSELFEGFDIGPFFYMFAPWVLVWLVYVLFQFRLRPQSAMLALWLIFFGLFWFFTYQSNRFFLPGWAIMIVIACLAARLMMQRLIVARILISVALALVLGFNLIDTARWFLFDAGRFSVREENGRFIGVSGVHWPAFTTGHLTRREFLTLQLNYYPLAEYCSTRLPEDAKVLLVGEHRLMHWECNVVGSDWFDRPLIVGYIDAALARNADNPVDAVVDALRADGFTHVAVNLQEMLAAWQYQQGHFSEAGLAVFQSLLESKRLQKLFSPMPDRLYVAKIQE
ncbi:MAG: ArnT family glycosyltransferase, partial [bacterium]